MRWISLCLLVTPSLFALQKTGNCATVPGSCPESAPCCSQYGWCGSSTSYCGVGCQLIGNFPGIKCQIESVSKVNHTSPPSFEKPKCKSGTYSFSSSNVKPAWNYNGDSETTDFTVDGGHGFLGSTLQLKMPGANKGATVYSTRPIHYGKITAVMRTSRTKGVVSSFITRSTDKDEIDFEWVGGQLSQTQTNWFGKGIFPPWPKTNGLTLNSPNTYSNFHSYTIDWNRQRIIWLIDNKPIRTVYASNNPRFPTSPARIELGIWDGGSNAPGTRNWAGGYIDWKASDMRNQGFFDIQVKSITIQCA